MQYSIIQKSKLEGALWLDAEYHQPEYLNLVKNFSDLGRAPNRRTSQHFQECWDVK